MVDVDPLFRPNKFRHVVVIVDDEEVLDTEKFTLLIFEFRVNASAASGITQRIAQSVTTSRRLLEIMLL